jgi:hypothetical protein
VEWVTVRITCMPTVAIASVTTTSMVRTEWVMASII